MTEAEERRRFHYDHNGRTPQDYAIEHAGYMAAAATRLLLLVNAEDAARMRHDDRGTAATGKALDFAMDRRGEATVALREAIYEFEKRRDRAAGTDGVPAAHQISDSKNSSTSPDGVLAVDPVRAALQEMVDMMDNGDEHGAGSPWHQRATAALAGVPAAPALPTTAELESLWETTHYGHPADFAADVLERWGGWMPGLLGHGGALQEAVKVLEERKRTRGVEAWRDPDTGRTASKPQPMDAADAARALGVLGRDGGSDGE